MNFSERNSNIELLRIVLTIMVISLHFNNQTMGGAFNYVEKGFCFYFLYFLEAISICAVNCFMIISGYFLAYNKRVKFAKILDLYFVVIFYRLFDYFLAILFFNGSFSVQSFVFRLIPANYFFIFYSITYIFSPFLCRLFDSLSDKNAIAFVSVTFVIFILWPSVMDFTMDLTKPNWLNAVSPISSFGNANGYSIVQFFVDIIIGMYLRRKEVKCNILHLLILFFISVFCTAIGMERFHSFFSYCSVFNIMAAVSLFLIFNKVHIHNKLINNIAKSCFAIFCIHVSQSMLDIWKMVFITEQHMKNGGGNDILDIS